MKISHLPSEDKNEMGQPYPTLYVSWLEEMYGETKMQKFWRHLKTLDGLQDMLDVVGIFFEGAELLNSIISLL